MVLTQDQYAELKYTDVDYVVFTDAAELLANGGSPYDRPTYRYPPLLALLLVPTASGYVSFGKVLFCLGDLLAGYRLYQLCRCCSSHPAATLAASSWLLNPVVINISTRGNCDGLVVAGILAFLGYEPSSTVRRTPF